MSESRSEDGHATPKRDPLRAVLPTRVLTRWRELPDVEMRRLGRALEAAPPPWPTSFEEQPWPAEVVEGLVFQAALRTYLETAERTGLLAGREGQQLREALRSGNAHRFRGGVAECALPRGG